MNHRSLVVAAMAATFAAYAVSPRLEAQSAQAGCTSYSALTPDISDPLAYSVPIALGSFADIEVGAPLTRSVQLEIEVIEQSAIRDRRILIIAPGRVELVSDLLGTTNLFELGSPLLVRLRADQPVSAVLVRRD